MFFACILMVAYLVLASSVEAADSNTVSSTVVTDKSVPTANAPSVVVSNNDVCKSAGSASVQTQVLGVATGITITDLELRTIKVVTFFIRNGHESCGCFYSLWRCKSV